MKLRNPVDFPTTARSRTRRRLLIAGSALVVIAAVYLGFSYFVISSSLTPRPICPAGTPLDNRCLQMATPRHTVVVVRQMSAFG